VILHNPPIRWGLIGWGGPALRRAARWRAFLAWADARRSRLLARFLPLPGCGGRLGKEGSPVARAVDWLKRESRA
jgi:hypothetical protein